MSIINYIYSILKLHKNIFLTGWFLCFTFVSLGQVSVTLNRDEAQIGEEVIYNIAVEVDSTKSVVFPEGQTFLPLEMIESYQIDTVIKEAKLQFIKKYGLTQFDSGRYTIPKQKVIVGDKTIVLDSLLIEIKPVIVDTTKQKLFDVKPMIKVKKPTGNWWKYLLLGVLIASLIGFLLYWFIWRKKPLTEEEKIALLPPYDRAKLALQKLDESGYLDQDAYKDYYSELTLAIRKYLDEKVYDKALESTTDELMTRLHILCDGNQISLSKTSLNNLESILKRADLVKFAKSNPDKALAVLDRKVVDEEIDHVKEALPEPTEEEKLQDEAYKKREEAKQKRRKIGYTACAIMVLLASTFVGFGIKYGFKYTFDTIIQKESKILLEGDWINSDYGFPPVSISTPKVLKRDTITNSQTNIKVAAFKYNLDEIFSIVTQTTQFPKQQQQPGAEKQDPPEIDIAQAVEGNLKALEAKGAKNIVSTNKKFTTPNGAEGLKTSGTIELPITKDSDQYVYTNFTILTFSANKEQVLQQIFITYLKEDVYLNDIHDRMIDSIELKPKDEKED
jgi:hypothetical protein